MKDREEKLIEAAENAKIKYDQDILNYLQSKDTGETNFFINQLIDFAKSQATKDYHSPTIEVDELRKEFAEWYRNTGKMYIDDAFNFFLPHLKSKSEWISVEYAPKDGTKLLGFCEDSECSYIIYWNRSMGNGCWNCDGSPYLPKIKLFQFLSQPPTANINKENK